MKIQGEVKVKAKIGIKKREVIEKEEVEVAKEEKVEVIVVVEVKKEIKEIEVEEGEIEVGLIALVKVMIIGKKILIQEEMTEIASKMKTMIEIMTEDIKKIIIQIEVMIALIQNLEDIKMSETEMNTIKENSQTSETLSRAPIYPNTTKNKNNDIVFKYIL